VLNLAWALYLSYSDFETEMGYISGKAKHESAKITSFQLQFLFGVPITNQGPRNVAYLNVLLLLADL
jgi:hypothetical protein